MHVVAVEGWNEGRSEGRSDEGTSSGSSLAEDLRPQLLMSRSNGGADSFFDVTTRRSARSLTPSPQVGPFSSGRPLTTRWLLPFYNIPITRITLTLWFASTSTSQVIHVIVLVVYENM